MKSCLYIHFLAVCVQVYRATLAAQYGGGEVAVKVQRPALRRSIALDLFLMRRLALFVRTIPEVSLLFSALLLVALDYS